MNDLDRQPGQEDVNPFTGIWLRTRETVRFVLDQKSTQFITLLVVLGGISAALTGALDSELDRSMPVWGVLLTSVLIGPVVGAAASAVAAGVFWLLGKLFKGRATYGEMFKATVTAQIPQIWLIPVLVLWMGLSPRTFFFETGLSAAPAGEQLLSALAAVLVAVVGIWTIVVQSKAVGEAHRFSSWLGFAVIMIPVLLVLGVVIFLMVVLVTSVL